MTDPTGLVLSNCRVVPVPSNVEPSYQDVVTLNGSTSRSLAVYKISSRVLASTLRLGEIVKVSMVGDVFTIVTAVFVEIVAPSRSTAVTEQMILSVGSVSLVSIMYVLPELERIVPLAKAQVYAGVSAPSFKSEKLAEQVSVPLDTGDGLLVIIAL